MIAKSALRSVFRWTATLGVLAAVSALPAAAVVVDDFSVNQGPLSDPPGGASTVPGGMLGGHRGLVVDLTSGAGPVDTEVSGGFLIAAVTDTTPDSRGAAFVTWDGDTNANVLSATGLGSADLTASGHTAFAVTVDAAAAGTEIVLEVYTDAANMSRAALRLPAVASSTAFYLSYKSDFVTRLGTGADFADAGAIVMTVRGTETAVTIDKVETAAPGLAAVKEDLTLGDVAIGATPQVPGTTFKYKVTITNTGGEALAVDLSDTIDANTTITAATVDATPVAVGDAYEAYGNVTKTVAAPGPLANDVDPDQNGAPPELVVDTSGSPVTTALGGTATLSADGAFVYEPPAGVARAVDTFTYTVTDNEGNATTATATMNVGRRIWFVDDDADVTAGVDGTGTLADPYDQLTPLAAAGGAGDPDEPGDLIFLYAGTYASGIELEAQQELIGHAEGLTLDGDPVVAAGAAPTINNAGGHGIVLAADNTIRGLTVGNTAGADVNGSNFGTLTVSNVTLNGTGAALNLSNGTLAATFNSMSSTNSLGRGVNLDTVTGSLVSGSTTVTDSAQAGIRVVNGGSSYNFGTTSLVSTTSGLELTNNATSTFNFTSLAVTTDAGAGLMASSSGTLTIGGTSNTIVATGGAALDVTSTSFGAGATFSTVSSSGSGGKGFSFDGVSGGFTATGGSISSATGIAFDVNAGTGAISYAGGITNAAARAVEVTGRTTSTLTLSGNISDSGTGVNIASNSGGTITLSGTYSGTAATSQIDVTGNSGTAVVNFSGSSKVLSTGASNAIDVTTNGTAAVNFTGGGLAVTTTSGVGFNATGGAGGVTVQGSGNTLTSTTGTALNVVGSTIGGSGITFQSISANGASSGIVLNATGAMGGLTVTGTGVAGSGGTIQSSTATGVLLTSTTNVNLAWMSVQTSADDGINGTTVNGFSLANSSVTNNGNSTTDEGIELVNPAGAITLTSVTATGNAHNNAYINDADNTGGNSSLMVTGGSFSSNSAANGNHGMLMEIRGTAVLATSIITGTTFSNNKSIGLQVTTADTATISDLTVTASTFTDTGTGNSQEVAMDFSKAQTSNLTVKVVNNTTITGHNTHAMNFFTAAGAGTTGTFNARITGNFVGNAAVAGSGSLIGNCIRININGDADASVLVDGNTLRQCPNGRGIEAIGRNGTGGLDITVTNNDVNPQDTSGFPLAAIFVQSNTATVANTVRANIANNTVPAGTAFDLLPTFLALVETSTSTCELVGTMPTATAQLTATNTGSASASAGCAVIAGPISVPP